MDNTPLLQKALGEDWNKLPPVIRQHYTVPSDFNTCLKGSMDIVYPNYLLPLISLIHLCGGLDLRRDKAYS